MSFMVIINNTIPVLMDRLHRKSSGLIGHDDMKILKLHGTTVAAVDGRPRSFKVATTPIPTGLGPSSSNMSSTSPLFKQQQQKQRQPTKKLKSTLSSSSSSSSSTSLPFRESPSSAFTRLDRRQSKQNEILNCLRRGSRVNVLGQIGDDDDQSLAPSASSSCMRKKNIFA